MTIKAYVINVFLYYQIIILNPGGSVRHGHTFKPACGNEFRV
jgi:hypothetical protein